MENVVHVEVNGRGVKSDDIAREIVDLIAKAALRDGKVAISYMRYGDDPARVGIPMKAFATISSDWESIEGEVARYNPDRVHVSFILDPTLSRGMECWAHMGRRSVLEKVLPRGLVIANTAMDPEDYLRHLPRADSEYVLVTVDGGGLERPSVLPLLGALAAESPVVSEKALRETLGEKYKDLERFLGAKRTLKRMEVPAGRGGGPVFPSPPPLPGASEMPIGVKVPAVPVGGRNPDFKTGSNRTHRPVLDRDQCVRCRTCWIFCPDAAIDIDDDGYPSFDLDYCTGCGICAENCPVEAIGSQLELEAEVR